MLPCRQRGSAGRDDAPPRAGRQLEANQDYKSTVNDHPPVTFRLTDKRAPSRLRLNQGRMATCSHIVACMLTFGASTFEPALPPLCIGQGACRGQRRAHAACQLSPAAQQTLQLPTPRLCDKHLGSCCGPLQRLGHLLPAVFKLGMPGVLHRRSQDSRQVFLVQIVSTLRNPPRPKHTTITHVLAVLRLFVRLFVIYQTRVHGR